MYTPATAQANLSLSFWSRYTVDGQVVHCWILFFHPYSRGYVINRAISSKDFGGWIRGRALVVVSDFFDHGRKTLQAGTAAIHAVGHAANGMAKHTRRIGL